MKPILKKDTDGAEYPYCPVCGEPVYFSDVCILCGQKFDDDEEGDPRSERMVAVGDYMVAQASNHHVSVYGSDGSRLAHINCRRELTDEELIGMVDFVCDLREGEDG